MLYIKRDYGTFTDSTIATSVSQNTTIQNIKITTNNKYDNIIYDQMGTNTKIINNTLTINNTQHEVYGTPNNYTRAILLWSSKNTTIENNTITSIGPATEPLIYNQWVTETTKTANTQAILAVNSQNTTIHSNNITVTNSTTPTTDSTLEAITLLNTNNTQITQNTINITGAETNTPINTTETSTNTIIEDNTIILPAPKENMLKVDTTEFIIGQPATIRASIYYGDEINTTINKGKISFKVNGKTLKDANGKVIYAKVVNGVATIENYIIPESWANEGTTIQAVYSGSSDLAKMTSQKEEIQINTQDTTITTTDITATAGETVTLTATINSPNTINSGKVVFKINGKSIKDGNGKVIYTKVVNNQVSVTYTLPADMKAQEYNITAVFLSPDYDRLEDTKTLTVN